MSTVCPYLQEPAGAMRSKAMAAVLTSVAQWKMCAEVLGSEGDCSEHGCPCPGHAGGSASVGRVRDALGPDEQCAKCPDRGMLGMLGAGKSRHVYLVEPGNSGTHSHRCNPEARY